MVGLVRPELVYRVHRLLNGRVSYSLWLRGPLSRPSKLLGWGPARGRAAASNKGIK
jgi:hypothetical protein